MLLFRSALLLAKRDKLFGGKDAWKYLLRGLATYPWSRRWVNYLYQHEQCLQLLQLQPRLLFKLQRPYLRKQVCMNRKLDWLRAHYGWMLANWPWAFVQRLYQQRQAELAVLTGDSGEHYRLLLQPTERCDKEGDLLLLLEHREQPLAFLSFTIHREGEGWVANVGCLQGPCPSLGREAVKAATQDLHGLRPKQAVLTALCALTTGYGIDQIHAVSNAGHIYQAKTRRSKRISADYDSFWAEMGGVLQGESFHLPPTLPRKLVADIPSRKRAQYRRRHEVEDRMIAALRENLPGCQPAGVFRHQAAEASEPALQTIQLPVPPVTAPAAGLVSPELAAI
ncbi:VirK/YbjX family protein [Chitinimonas sp.]|uniref:VirK/YbjX family protein n=1 Tax=Chitinimonas sp. TaxID=1934313 RepID=UPI002F91C061